MAAFTENDPESDSPNDDDSPSDEWYSGPYCRHYGDPSDCDALCFTCKHPCRQHHAECGECGCQVWEEDPEE